MDNYIFVLTPQQKNHHSEFYKYIESFPHLPIKRTEAELKQDIHTTIKSQFSFLQKDNAKRRNHSLTQSSGSGSASSRTPGTTCSSASTTNLRDSLSRTQPRRQGSTSQSRSAGTITKSIWLRRKRLTIDTSQITIDLGVSQVSLHLLLYVSKAATLTLTLFLFLFLLLRLSLFLVQFGGVYLIVDVSLPAAVCRVECSNDCLKVLYVVDIP